MNSKSFAKIKHFLKNDLGLSDSSILLGLKLSSKNKNLLPVAMWSHGIIDNLELEKFYKFLYEN